MTGASDADDEALDLLDRIEATDRRDWDLLAVDREFATRQGQVVGLEDPGDLLGRDPRLGHQVWVQGDHEVILQAAREVDIRDARDRGELRDDLRAGDLGRFLEVGPSRAETEAMTIGAALKSNAPTVGSTPWASLALWRFCSMVATAASRSAP